MKTEPGTQEPMSVDRLVEALREALWVIADGEGDPQVIARQTLEQLGFPTPRTASASPAPGKE